MFDQTIYIWLVLIFMLSSNENKIAHLQLRIELIFRDLIFGWWYILKMLILRSKYDKIMLALLALYTVNLWDLDIKRYELFGKLALLWISVIMSILIFFVGSLGIIYNQNSLLFRILRYLRSHILAFLFKIRIILDLSWLRI